MEEVLTALAVAVVLAAKVVVAQMEELITPMAVMDYHLTFLALPIILLAVAVAVATVLLVVTEALVAVAVALLAPLQVALA